MRTLCLFSLATLLAAPACGSDGLPGPYDALAVDERIDADGLTAPVEVVRDAYGVPHIYARSVADLAFAQGYVVAADRIQQMDLFRHFAAGRVGELFGALDPSQLDGDLEMRIHRFEALATESFAQLQASDAPADRELVTFLQRFSDGVNRFVADVREGRRTLDPEVRTFFDAASSRPWTPVDSLVIGRLQAMSLSYSEGELSETAALQAARDGFDAATDPAAARRAGAYFDLVRFAPRDRTAIRDGWPVSGAPAPRTGAPRPRVPQALLTRLAAERSTWLQRLMDPRNGSNNWVVGGALAGGKALMANDPHLSLASPSIFWPCHLTVEGDEALDVAGITFPGIPGVILGHNEHVAWGATTVNHDVTDFYLEEIAPCPQGGGDCTTFSGQQVPIETWQETLRVGVLGAITSERTVTFERVPHHGPIMPTIVDGDVAPRPPGPAISVRYTGHEVTFELAAFQGLWRSTNVAEAKAAMAPFGFGGQNWVFADDTGSIGWTTQALVPWRTEGCFTFDPATGEGVAPWWVVPGDGSCEWDGWIDAAYLPQDVDPARGFLVTANADPVGATFDGDPLNEPVLGGRQLYVGAREYDEGYRVGRITRRLEAIAAEDRPMTTEDMASVQADTYSNLGSALTPAILEALAAFDAEVATPGARPDLQDFVAGLGAERRARLADARALLADWTFETPAALDAADDSREGADSAATVVFNAWLVEAARRLLGDEAAVLDRGTGGWMTNVMIALLTAPETLRTGLAEETGEPLLCDRMTTTPIESCTLGILAALDAAMAWGAGPEGPGGPAASWRWGDLHRLTLEPLIPSEALVVPPRDETDPALVGGYPRAGDNHSVDASSPGADDFDFRYGHGPAMRHVTVVGGGERPRTLLALPGGVVMDTRSPHWRDLMDEYWSVNGYFELPWTTTQVLETAESRWRFE